MSSKALEAKAPPRETTPIVAPPSAAVPKAPKEIEKLAKKRAELHLFDFASGSFMLQDGFMLSRGFLTNDGTAPRTVSPINWCSLLHCYASFYLSKSDFRSVYLSLLSGLLSSI